MHYYTYLHNRPTRTIVVNRKGEARIIRLTNPVAINKLLQVPLIRKGA